jgi:hypothetical protein
MTLAELMASHEGKWENDYATVHVYPYFVRVASRIGEVVTILDEGLRSFPDLVLTNKQVEKKLTKSTLKVLD